MIGIIDTFTLARAKLHSKRVLLAITVVVSGLLFGILYGAIIISSGVAKSANEFTKTALDGKYLVKSTPTLPSSIFGPSRNNLSKGILDELRTMQADYTAKQKVLAKQLNITYDEKNAEQILIPDPYASKNLPEDERVMINQSSPVYQVYLQKLQEDYAAVAKNKLSDLKTLAVPYGAVAYYQNTSASINFTNTFYLKDGKENLASIGQYQDPVNSDMSMYGYMTSSVQNSMYSFVDDSLVSRFIIPQNEKQQQNNTAIPVLITSKEAVDLFGSKYGIPKEPGDALGQVTWMKDLQQKVNGITYAACYRNDAEISQLAQITQTAIEIETNKSNINYSKPSLVYNLPTTPCGAVTVKEDTRTVAEKDLAQQQEDTSKKLGTYIFPQHHLFIFQIVGVMSVSPQEDAMKSLPAFMSELLGAQYGVGAIIPRQMYDKLPSDVRREDILLDSKASGFSTNILEDAGINEAIVEFSSLDNARSFMKNQGCSTQDQCNMPFTLEPYGANYLLVDDLSSTVAKILQVAFPVALGVAGIIISVTMARVIIDSRRETAIFRAIGANRSDIVSVYLLYSANVALRVIVFGLFLGVSIAGIVQILYSAQVTNYAKVAYGIFDRNQTFSFVNFDLLPLMLLTICIFAISIIAILPSLIRNVRRNPIKDMRDE